MRYVAFFVLALCGAGFAPASSAEIRLNEILADPAGDWDGDGSVSSRNDEWVEIINVGSSSVDLTGYRLGDTSGGTSWRFGFDGTLAPGEIRVVYGSQALLWQTQNGFPANGLSLNNAGDTVYLYEVFPDDTVVADSYTYEAVEVQDDRSTGRRPDGTGAWFLFDAHNPYPGSDPPIATGCMPSPGASNAMCVTPVVPSSWGLVKSLYRG